jgi:hypothetical protein
MLDNKGTLSSNARAQYSIHQPFVIGVAEVAKIIDLLTRRIGPVRLEAHCTDSLIRSFSDLDSLSRFENESARKITELDIVASSEDRGKRASIHLTDSEYNQIFVAMSGPQQEIERLNPEVHAIIKGLRPWYYLLADYHPNSVIFMFFAIFGLSAGLVGLAGLIAQFFTPVERLSAFIALLVSGILTVALTTYVRPRICPVGVFAIGQQKTWHDFLDKVRWGVCVALVVGIAAGLILLGGNAVLVGP